MFRRRWLILLSVVPMIFAGELCAQPPAVSFIEAITEDSVKLFFNEADQFTEKECSHYIRYVRVDTDGFFNSDFRDVAVNGNWLRAKGSYVHGKRHGAIEHYFPTGKVERRGTYDHDLPVGRWEFFYPDGSPERALRFTEKDTLLVSFFDLKGNQTVKFGEGEFSGAMHVASTGLLVHSTGAIRNGKQEGSWISVRDDNNDIYCKEEFAKGKFVKGNLAPKPGLLKKDYKDASRVFAFLPLSYVDYLDAFNMISCAAMNKRTNDVVEKISESADLMVPAYDSDLFMRLLDNKIKEAMGKDFEKGDRHLYRPGMHHVVVQYKVDLRGNPSRFNVISDWGLSYSYGLEDLIRRNVKMPGTPEVWYFHLYINVRADLAYTYKANFSVNKEK